MITIAALGLIHSWWGLLTLPAAMVVGFGFAGMAIGTSTFLRSWQDFDTVQLVQLPMFLFSATFYPLSVYPVAIQWFVRFSPLYHAIQLDPVADARHRRPDHARARGLPDRARLLRHLARPPPHGRVAADLGDQWTLSCFRIAVRSRRCALLRSSWQAAAMIGASEPPL